MYTLHHVHSPVHIVGLVDTSRAPRLREAHCQERAWNHLVMRLLAGTPLAYAGTMCITTLLLLPTLLENELLRHICDFLGNCVAHRVASQAWSTLDALFIVCCIQSFDSAATRDRPQKCHALSHMRDAHRAHTHTHTHSPLSFLSWLTIASHFDLLNTAPAHHLS
jgi:hypothetical protein